VSRKYLNILYGFLILVISLIVFRESILYAYANWFAISNATSGADALICLSGGRHTRVPKAMHLWSQGYAESIYLTEEKTGNGEFAHLDLSNLRFAREAAKLMKLDVPWKVVPSQDGGATSTFDEASDTFVYAKEKEWNRLIIVTDHFHTRRALLAFNKVFKGSEITVQVEGVGNDVFNNHNWWKSDRGIMTYLSETIKFPVYLFWNAEPGIVSNH
jgi:uncharacterized SAM-binding protein YcdF (DUF218 family)